MNAPFVPVDLHGTSVSDHLLTLLAVIKDPVIHQARLEELIAQENAVKEQIAALNDMADRTRRDNSASAALTIVLNNRKTALDAREVELDERAKIVEQSENAKSDKALRLREATAQSRELAIAKDEERLAALRTELEQRIAKIKAATA